MPSLGADMDRGTLLEWKVAPGDTVNKGDLIAVIDTEKSDIDAESFHSGVVTELLVEEGTEVEVGTPLAIIDDGASAPQGEPEATPATTTLPEPPAAHRPVVHSPIVRRLAEERGIDLSTVQGTGPGGAVTRRDLDAVTAPQASSPPTAGRPATGRVRSSPLARRRADEMGVDLGSVTGTGPDEAVTVADVEAAAGELPRTPPTEPSREPSTERTERASADQHAERGDRSATVRAATGRLMARSKREIPHYYLSTAIDLSDALDWLERTNRDRAITERVLPAALLLRAVVVALTDQPRLNGWWVDDELVMSDRVDLGVGVTLRGGGLIAPVIPAAETLDLDQTMDALRGIVSRARSGRIKGTDLGEASITVTNLGDQGVESVYGVIAPPQVAVVGFGAISERPVAVDGMLGVRTVVTATLSADHRSTDGHEGARYLSALDRLLHEPEAL